MTDVSRLFFGAMNVSLRMMLQIRGIFMIPNYDMISQHTSAASRHDWRHDVLSGLPDTH